jgi:hypothetical protein
MKLLAWLSFVSGVVAVTLLAFVVIAKPEWRSQVLDRSLPLEFGDAENTLAFLPQVVLGPIAVLAGLIAFRRRLAWFGILLGVVAMMVTYELVAVPNG